MMSFVSGTQNSYVNYSCTYPAVQPTDKYYYIWSNDSRGAWNVSSQQQLLPIDEEVVVDVTIIGANTTVPLTPTGAPNFTRGMNIEYKTTAFVRNRTNGLFIEDCNGDVGGNCDAFDPSDTQIDWDGFVDAWKGNYSSAGYACDQYNDFRIRVERNDGLSGSGVKQIFISCEPRLVIDPIERRLALGQNGMEIFKLTLYNPQNTAAFTIRMNSQDPNGWPLPWIIFDCDGNGDCGYIDLNNDIAVMNVDAASSGTIFVNMSSGGRAGVYPIEFIANKTALDKYTTIGTLMIFAESLDEFAVWQLVVILLIAGLVYVRIGRKK
jgi:hypothetical protein